MIGRSPAWTAGGLSALAAGLLWAVKGLSILMVGYQPPLLFELAVPLFGLTLVSLAWRDGPLGRVRAAQVSGGVACAAGVVAVGSELVGAVLGLAIAVAMVAVIVGLIIVGVVTRAEPKAAAVAERLAFLIGLSTVPAILVGGLLSMIDERLLEVPLVMLAGMWAWLGALMLHMRSASR